MWLCFVVLFCAHVYVSCHTYHFKVISGLKQMFVSFQHHAQAFPDPTLVDLIKIEILQPEVWSSFVYIIS
jgi:hypothetical protein